MFKKKYGNSVLKRNSDSTSVQSFWGISYYQSCYYITEEFLSGWHLQHLTQRCQIWPDNPRWRVFSMGQWSPTDTSGERFLSSLCTFRHLIQATATESGPAHLPSALKIIAIDYCTPTWQNHGTPLPSVGSSLVANNATLADCMHTKTKAWDHPKDVHIKERTGNLGRIQTGLDTGFHHRMRSSATMVVPVKPQLTVLCSYWAAR